MSAERDEQRRPVFKGKTITIDAGAPLTGRAAALGREIAQGVIKIAKIAQGVIKIETKKMSSIHGLRLLLPSVVAAFASSKVLMIF